MDTLQYVKDHNRKFVYHKVLSTESVLHLTQAWFYHLNRASES